MAKRQDMPELPEALFLEAEEAWKRAIRADDSDRASLKVLRPDLKKLQSFHKLVREAYDNLPSSARSNIDPDMRYFLKDGIPPPTKGTWIGHLEQVIEDLRFILERQSGDNQISDTGINLIGLRAFAVAVTINFGPSVLTNSGPPPGV